MARFSDSSWLERNWQLMVVVVAAVATITVGLKLSELAARAIDPFYAPAVMGFASGLLLIGLHRLHRARSEFYAEDDEANSGYLPSQWLKTPEFDLAVLLLFAVYLAFRVYPSALGRAVSLHITDDAYFFGLYISLLVLWGVETRRKFSLKRAAK